MVRWPREDMLNYICIKRSNLGCMIASSLNNKYNSEKLRHLNILLLILNLVNDRL